MCTTNHGDGKTSHSVPGSKTCNIIRGIAFNMIKHAFLVFRTYLDLFIDYIFSLYWEAKRTPLPNLEKKHIVLKEDAVSIAAKIRNRQLKSEDLVQMCIERIKIRFFGDLYYCTGWSMMNGKKCVSGSHSPQNPNLGTDDCLTGL